MPRRVFTECVFCEASPPLTKEHVWPKWLRNVMLSNNEFPHRHTTTIAGVAEERWAAPPFTMQLEAVCADCNNGWMSRMEATAKPILTPMIAGQRVTLSVEDQRAVARWVAKTALVFQLATKHNSIRTNQYRYLKNNLKPPPGNQVWLAARTAEEPIPCSFGMRTANLRKPDDDSERFNYLVTIALGHFIAQIYGNDNPFDSEWVRHGEFEDALLPIWPESEPASWPPRRVLRACVPLAEDPGFEDEIGRAHAARSEEVRLGQPRVSAMPGRRPY